MENTVTKGIPRTAAETRRMSDGQRRRRAMEAQMDSTRIDYAGSEAVGALIDKVRASGLTEAAEVFSNAYWGWLRLTSAYVNAHPYVAKPEPPTMTPISALSVTDSTLRHWAELIPGSPKLNDAAVIREAERDEEWHRQEDRRMRIDAGEDIL